MATTTITAKARLKAAVHELGYNENQVNSLDDEIRLTASTLRRRKTQRQIRYLFYCKWVQALKKAGLGVPGVWFSLPPEILAFIREILPRNVVGEVRDEATPVTLKTFCEHVL
ncbi:uncharacterized protein [Amphiura filiformis]|uniref:uncharacterized protein n=1 Tax=Amphiura filiformis TaxID=82378 RepID=UPI003B216ED2